MKKFLGFLLILLAIGFGLYVGGWLLFILGIVQIIEAFKAGISALDIAVGIFRVFVLAPIAEWLTFIAITCGFCIIMDE